MSAEFEPKLGDKVLSNGNMWMIVDLPDADNNFFFVLARREGKIVYESSIRRKDLSLGGRLK